MLRIGVTGTDTAVGKTVVASAMVGLLRSRGLRTGVMKPIETGVTRGEPGSDHMFLATAADVDPDTVDICPYILDGALAPWVAARAANIEISDEVLDQAFQRICCGNDCVVVEGAGGLLVPITRTMRFDQLFARWELELVIVALDRLGVINHTLLTVQAAERAGVRVRGIVLNQLHRSNEATAQMNNANVLRELLPQTPLIEFPSVEGLHGLRPLHTFRDPLDFGLLRDVALASGLASLLLERAGTQTAVEG